ncbi:LOW QUALITY PROTEIN: hypothetical protein YC2023_115077 [Brassica napus]
MPKNVRGNDTTECLYVTYGSLRSIYSTQELAGVSGIEINNSSHDHDKSSSSRNIGSGHSNISEDEYHKVRWKDNDNEAGLFSEANTVVFVPNQNVPVARNALFMGYIANVILERQPWRIGERHGVDELFKQSVNLGDGISSGSSQTNKTIYVREANNDGRKIDGDRRIWPKNSSASSDLAGELIVVVRSGRRTNQRRRIWPKNSIVGSIRITRRRCQIWPENSSSSSDLAGELVSVVGSDRRTHSCRR